MSTTITLPQARIALGWVVVQGVRHAVEIDMEWMLALARLVERTGGVSGDTNFSEYINQLYDTPPLDLGAREALRAVDELRNELYDTPPVDVGAREALTAVDELRNELESTRSEVQVLRGLIDELAARIESSQQTDQLRNRIESIEDRLA